MMNKFELNTLKARELERAWDSLRWSYDNAMERLESAKKDLKENPEDEDAESNLESCKAAAEVWEDIRKGLEKLL
jgi:hypothetical protein